MKAKILLLLLIMVVIVSAQPKWENLFNNKDLSGWKLLNGQAKYTVVDGVLIGSAVLNTPNSFLVTEKSYSDFILELDFKTHPLMNSGIQIRSESKPDYKDGKVFGYQMEIDPSARAWTGGIYDEARRGWLYTLDENPKAKKAFKQSEWNHARIEVFGNSIRTWVNGIACADILDDMTKEGFIGLPVHGIANDKSKEGITVCWKNVRIITKDVEKYLTKKNNSIPQFNYVANSLTQREINDGWRLLWDGKTTDGWHGVKSDKFPDHGWEIKDGTLRVMKSANFDSRAGGDIITTKRYKNFELKVEFKITDSANSGIKYLVDPTIKTADGTTIGCEYQILDDVNHPDAKLGVAGNRTSAGLYDIIAPINKRFNDANQWNQAKIVVNGNHVEHWLNGFKTVEYERANQMWRALVANSKFKKIPDYGEASEGYILLQDHANEVWFRNIKIKELN